MFDRAPRDAGSRRRLLPSPSMLVAGMALFGTLGGTAVAADRLIRGDDLAPNAVTGAKIKDGSVALADLQPKTVTLLRGGTGATGVVGALGPTGATGATGANGLGGTNGVNGATGAAGTNGLGGTNGANGATGAAGTNGLGGINGANGATGPDGAPGQDGIDGTNGTDGTDGADGVLGPLSATGGLVVLPTATPPTTVVQLTVPAAEYVVMAKSQISHSGAGDTVRCELKAGAVTIDEASMKTLPALAAIPISLQAVTTTAPTQLSVQCDVSVADGAANFTSLIALPVS